MKNIKYHMILSALAVASSLNAANYTYQSGSWNEASSWQIDGQPAESVPGSSDNVTMIGDPWALVPQTGYIISINNLDVNNCSFSLLSDGDRPDIDQWKSTLAPTLIVAGNITTNGTVLFGNMYGDNYGYGFKSVSVAGNFYVGSDIRVGALRDTTYTSSDPSMTIGGQLQLNANARMLANYNTNAEAYYKIGGLSSTAGVICNNESTGNANIEFVQNSSGVFTGGDYSGSFTSYGQPFYKAHFNFIMNDTSGGANSQIIRLLKIGAYGDSDQLTTLTVSVKSGKLEMYSDGGDGLTTLSLTGGTFGIVGSNSEAITGMAKFSDSFTWTAGKIEITVNIDNMNADILEVDNLILAGSDATYEFVFDMLGDFDETTDMHLKILTLTGEGSTFGADILSKLVGTTSDGLYIANFGLNVENNELYLNGFSQIPEPAEVAAFIGAVALAFAAWRRRK